MVSTEGPDQCWSWVIAMSAFVINLLLSGLSRATGVIYVALINDHGVSRFEANLPFTMRNCIRNLAGPVVGMIGQRYGVQEVTFVGGILATLGVTLCCVAPSVFWITVLWGGLHGLGVALANTLFQVTINQYFEKYRATAAGLALSGSCVGSFILPIILEIVLMNYGLAGAFLIAGGLVMHIFPATIFLKEPNWLRKRKTPNNISCEEKFKMDHSHVSNTPFSTTIVSKADWNVLETVEAVSIRKLSRTGSINYPEIVIQFEDEKLGDLKAKRRDQREHVTCGVKTISTGRLDESQMPKEFLNRKNENSDAGQTSMWKSLVQMYKNPIFHLLSMNLGIVGISYDPVATIIMDYSNDKGLDVYKGKYFISALACGDLLGRICFGWVTDKGFMTLPKFMLMLQVIQGLCFTLMPLFSNYEVLLTLFVIYGMSAGNTLTMFPVLIGKYLPDVQSLAIGCIAFFGGIISFSVPPLIGHFRDDVGSYDGMFYITGGLCILAGLLWLFEPWMDRFNRRRNG